MTYTADKMFIRTIIYQKGSDRHKQLNEFIARNNIAVLSESRSAVNDRWYYMSIKLSDEDLIAAKLIGLVN